MPVIGTPSSGSPVAQFDELVGRVRNLMGTDAKLSEEEIEEALRSRYEWMHDTFDWPERGRVAHLNSTLGLVNSTASTLATVTESDGTVSFAGTPITASMNGAQIRIGAEESYFFFSVTNTNTIELFLDPDLQDPATWTRASGGSQSWVIFRSVFPVSEDMAHVLSVAGRFQLKPFDGGLEALDLYDPYRLSVNNHATHWCYYHYPRTVIGQRRVELWPAATEQRVYKCHYLKAAAVSVVPTYVDLPVPPLVNFTAADCCHILHAKQGTREAMWEQKALFFERLGNEQLRDYKADRVERRQVPTELGRSFHRSRFAGTDFAVDHHIDLIP